MGYTDGYVAPPPIEVGDSVEVNTRGPGGIVGVVEEIDGDYFTVRLPNGASDCVYRPTYMPDPETVADRCAAIRATWTDDRRGRSSDYVGVDGPGLKEITVIVGPKGAGRAG